VASLGATLRSVLPCLRLGWITTPDGRRHGTAHFTHHGGHRMPSAARTRGRLSARAFVCYPPAPSPVHHRVLPFLGFYWQRRLAVHVRCPAVSPACLLILFLSKNGLCFSLSQPFLVRACPSMPCTHRRRDLLRTCSCATLERKKAVGDAAVRYTDPYNERKKEGR
jgi:hypothetical protein